MLIDNGLAIIEIGPEGKNLLSALVAFVGTAVHVPLPVQPEGDHETTKQGRMLHPSNICDEHN